MKINKIAVLLLTIWFAMMLIGCNTTGISNETGETNKESEEKILTQAPNVTISNSEEAVVLPFGPGEWEYNLNQDERSAYTACGAYPPDNKYEEGRNILTNDKGEIKVAFDTSPDSVKVTFWKMDLSGEEVTYSEEQVLEDVQERAGCWYFKVPEDKTIVCQIFAKWKRESYAGNSSYCIMLTAE